MPFPPVCFDCDKMISFDRYQIGVCPECEKERQAVNDPNWHRSTENHDELPGDTFCGRCGHMLRDHDVTDVAPCEQCDCEEFTDEPSAETLRSLNRGD